MTTTFRITTTRFALLLCLVLAPIAAHAQFEEEPDPVEEQLDRVNEEAWAAFETGDTSLARDRWQLVLGIDSTNLYALYGMGRLHFDVERFDSAIVFFSTAARVHAQESALSNWLAWSHYNAGDHGAAEQHAREAISRGNASVSPRLLLARIMYDGKRGAEIPEMMLRAERHAESTDDFNSVGDEYMRVRMFSQAGHAYMRAAALDTTSGVYPYRAGRALMQVARWLPADSAFALAITRGAPFRLVTRARYTAAVLRGDAAAAAAQRSLYTALPHDAGFDTLLIDGMMQLGMGTGALVRCYTELNVRPDNVLAVSRVAEIWNDLAVYHRACREVLRTRDLDLAETERLTARMNYEMNAARSCLMYFDAVEGPDSTFVAPTPDAAWREPVTGLVFPARHEGLRRTTVEKADLDELGTTVQYEWQPERGTGASITVSITPAPRHCMGPWFVLDAAGRRQPDTTGRGMLLLSEPSGSFTREYHAMLRETSLRTDKPVLAHESRFIASEQRKLIALQADFRIATASDRMSTMLLFTMADAYVTVDIRRGVAVGFENVELQRTLFDMMLNE